MLRVGWRKCVVKIVFPSIVDAMQNPVQGEAVGESASNRVTATEDRRGTWDRAWEHCGPACRKWTLRLWQGR